MNLLVLIFEPNVVQSVLELYCLHMTFQDFLKVLNLIKYIKSIWIEFGIHTFGNYVS